MSGIKGVLKDGWHPKGKEGKSESWRGDFKGINQVAGWVGKGKDGSDASTSERKPSRPLASLKDPSSFAPPPRRANTASSQAASSTHLASQAQDAEQEQEQEQEPEPVKRAPPPVPYRANTTGLTTDNLPPPPVRRNVNTNNDNDTPTKPPVKQKPSLPPRLPPRGAQSEEPPPPAYETVQQKYVPQLNQGAMNRLGNAGVSVPALGINEENSTTTTNNNKHPPVPPQNELQARFNQMKIGQSQPSPPARSPTQQHHQPALERTPNTSSRDSLNSFKERHNDHIQAGKRKLNGINQKYGITKRINSFIDDQKSPANQPQAPQPQQQQQQQQRNAPPPPPTHTHSAPSDNRNPDTGTFAKRKPPPPPPKKREMQSSPAAPAAHPSSPPPLPLSTKPR